MGDIFHHCTKEKRRQLYDKKPKLVCQRKNLDEDPLKNIDINQELNEKQREAIIQLLKKYLGIIPAKNEPLGCCFLDLKHAMDTGDNKSVRQSMRRFSPWQIKEIQR